MASGNCNGALNKKASCARFTFSSSVSRPFVVDSRCHCISADCSSLTIHNFTTSSILSSSARTTGNVKGLKATHRLLGVSSTSSSRSKNGDSRYLSDVRASRSSGCIRTTPACAYHLTLPCRSLAIDTRTHCEEAKWGSQHVGRRG